MTDKPQVKEYKEALENIVVIARSGEVLRGACGIDELKSALDKLTYTQADNYRAIRESK